MATKTTKNEYPDWLVPIRMTERLEELGLEPEIYVDTKTNQWYRAFEISTINILEDEEFETVKIFEDARKKGSSLEPAFNWDEVFAAFRDNNLIGLITHHVNRGVVGYKFEIVDYMTSDFPFDTYEQAREALIEELIKIAEEKK